MHPSDPPTVRQSSYSMNVCMNGIETEWKRKIETTITTTSGCYHPHSQCDIKLTALNSDNSIQAQQRPSILSSIAAIWLPHDASTFSWLLAGVCFTHLYRIHAGDLNSTNRNANKTVLIHYPRYTSHRNKLPIVADYYSTFSFFFFFSVFLST